jgi:eukaryotic-like serine/threonine-protein kinase
MEGTLIDGKYEVTRRLGEGGMGAVYEAQHRATGRKVALKVIGATALAAGPDIITRFEREARASGSIDSPHVVQVFDAGVDPTTSAPYMVMECLVGEDVQATVKRLGPLAPDVVLRVVAQACHGLQKAHDAGIVHRDIKSANLFLANVGTDGAEIVTKVLDFGIAKVRASPLGPAGADHKLTKTGSMLGSPVYMSPEQAMDARDLDGRSDIFSLGVVMYEVLSGATPNGHRESLGQLLMAICTEPAQPLQDRAPWVSAEIAGVVQKALAITPADRFQSAAELRAAVEALLPAGATTTITASMIAELPAETLKLRAPRRAQPQPAAALVATVIPAGTALDGGAYDATHIDPVKELPVASSKSNDAARGALLDAHAVSGAQPPSRTATGAGATRDAPRAPESGRRRLPWAAAFVVVVAIGGGGTYYLKHGATPAPLVQSAAPVESASAPASASSAPEPAVRTETVAVTPEVAAVEVDGKRVTVTGGRFELRGAVGSVHDVKLLLGDSEKHVDVVLAVDGPRPAKVDITPRATPAPAAVVRPAGSARAVPPIASSPGAKPPTGVPIDRNF